jgi:acetyl-CoA C-acetyltransferase
MLSERQQPRRKLARPVDIIGVGMSDLGLVTETPSMLHMTTRELWSWAAVQAIADAGIAAADIEALFVGNMIGEYAEGQYHLGYVLSQWTGLSLGQDAWRPGVRIEGACASSSHAIRAAVFAVAAGAYDLVIAGGVEISNALWTWQAPGEPRRMTNAERVKAIYGHYDQGWELPNMAMLDHSLSQWLIAYAKRYGLSPAALSDILDARVISNYENGFTNPRAYWKRSLAAVAKEAGFDDLREFLRSPTHNPPTCWPMRQWDGPRRCDGAGAVVICASEGARRANSHPVHYVGTGSALQSSAVSGDMYSQPFIVAAGQEAFAMAGLAAAEVGPSRCTTMARPNTSSRSETSASFPAARPAQRSLPEKRSAAAASRSTRAAGRRAASSRARSAQSAWLISCNSCGARRERIRWIRYRESDWSTIAAAAATPSSICWRREISWKRSCTSSMRG